MLDLEHYYVLTSLNSTCGNTISKATNLKMWALWEVKAITMLFSRMELITWKEAPERLPSFPSRQGCRNSNVPGTGVMIL